MLATKVSVRIIQCGAVEGAGPDLDMWTGWATICMHKLVAWAEIDPRFAPGDTSAWPTMWLPFNGTNHHGGIRPRVQHASWRTTIARVARAVPLPAGGAEVSWHMITLGLGLGYQSWVGRAVGGRRLQLQSALHSRLLPANTP
jgi:hypothetical protein